MNKKQVVVLFCAAVVLTLIGLIVVKCKQRSWHAPADEQSRLVLPDFAATVNDVAKIEIVDKDGKVQVHKKDGKWRVADRYDYAADFNDVSEFLRDLAQLKAVQTLNVGKSQYGRLELLPPKADEGAADGDKADDKDKTGALVTFYGADGKKTGAVILGKEHQKKTEAAPSPYGGGGSWPDGRYILVPSLDKVVLVSKTFSSVEADADDWLDKEFFKIGDMKEATLVKDGKEVWKASREKKSEDMKLVGLGKDEEQDNSKVNSVKNAFSWASFTDVADPELPPEETGMDKPQIFKAADFDGFTYTVKIGKETSDGKYHMAVDAEYDAPAEREAEEGESDEDRKKKDEEFKKKQEENQKKARDLKDRVTGWVYIVYKSTVDSVLKERKDLLKEKKKEEDKDKKKEDDAAKEEAKDDAPDKAKAEAPPPAPPKTAPKPPPAPPKAEAAPQPAQPKEAAKPVEAKPAPAAKPAEAKKAGPGAK